MVIEFEDPTSWPAEIIKILRANVNLLLAFDTEDKQRQREREAGNYADYHLRNKFWQDRKDILAKIADVATAFDVIGYHCTRLYPEEARLILDNGMKMSSKEFLIGRLERCAQAGHISEPVREQLVNLNQAGDDNRQNQIFFVCGPSIFSDWRGLFRFFRYWGGEALYNSHQDDEIVGSVLKQIGKPYIIQARLPLSNFHLFSLGDVFYKTFMKVNGFRPTIETGAEGYLMGNLPAEKISQVIAYDDAEFDLLTKASSWAIEGFEIA